MSEYIKISPEIRALGREAEREIRPYFERLEEICDRNTEKVLAAFAKNRVSDNLFAGTTGYGYDDYGRDTLDKIYADIFGTEAALVRIGFVNGTHALSCAMFSAVKTGDTVLVTSEFGRTLRSATVTNRIMPGVLGLMHGSWSDYDEENNLDYGGSDNILFGTKTAGQGTTGFNTMIVKIEKSDIELTPDCDKPRRIVEL